MKPSATLAFQLHALVYAIDQLAQGVVKKNSPVNFPQFLVVLCAYENPGHTQKFAATWLQLTEATVSYMVKRLVALGYLYIENDTGDSRVKHISCTQKGQMLIKTLYPLLEEAMQPHIKTLPKADFMVLTRSVHALYKSITNTMS